jgi:colanic acid/amylovoran biosynthesis glycosyltransferase
MALLCTREGEPVVREHHGNRIVTVVSVFPTNLQPYLVDRFVRLCEFGWDAWVVCDQFDEQEWARIPSLATNPELRKRVRVSDSDGPGSTVEELSPQLVHVAFGYIAPPLMDLRERLGCKAIVSFESYDSDLVGRPRVYQPVWTAADAVHAVSEHLWRFVRRAGCPAEKPHAVITPGVDADFFDPGPRVHTDIAGGTRPLRVLSVGRLDWAKGYEYGLQAIRLLENHGIPCDYRIVGEGELRSAVEYTIDDLRLTESVTVLGARSPIEIKAELGWADVLLHSSVSESFGIATIEAQAMMVPVVCSDANGLPEAVANEETGLVVPRRNPAALAEGLRRLATDPGERQRLGEAGRQRVQQQFAPEAQARRFDAFYRRVIALPFTARDPGDRIG